MSHRGKRRKSAKPKRRSPKVEWVGGLLETPFTIAPDDGPAYSPRMALWLQRPPGIIVANELVEPGATDGAVADALELARSRTGDAPTRVRVATQALAAEVRERVGPGLPIIVAPTPELDAVMAKLEAAMANGRPTTLFTHPGITPALLERFFTAARALWTAAPWKLAGDSQIIRVDAPEVGVEGACVSILGAAGQEFGIALFESLEHFDAFMRVAATRPDPRKPMDLGGDELLLSFDDERDLPAMMKREAKSLGLVTAGKRAFPTLLCMRRDASVAGPTAEQLALMTAVAAAVASFTVANRRLFENEYGAPVCQTFSLDGVPDVTLTAPYDARDAFDIDAAPEAPTGRARAHDFEETFFHDMMSFGFDRFGRAVFEEAASRLDHAGGQLAMPWLAYILEIEGATVAEHYARAERLPARVQAFLEAQRQSWLSVWEVVDFVAGESITLCDLLSGEERTVHEVAASQSVRKRTTLLGRVVDVEGEHVLNGLHMQSLPPLDGAEVVARARKRLRRKRAVPIERLRGEAFAWFLLNCWDDACERLERRAAVPPRMVNTEGHDLVMVVDRFNYEAKAHDWLLERLARIELVHVERASPTQAELTFHMEGNPQIESWDNTIIGRASAERGKLTVETNSRERADRLRARILEVAGDILRGGTRSFSDPMAQPNIAAMRAREPEPRGPVPPELLAVLAEHKASHYASWLDTPLPALDGATPREHVGTAEGRRAVEVLLNQMEFMEQADPDTAFDMSRLRAELGLTR